jgi:hypothetical protein
MSEQPRRFFKSELIHGEPPFTCDRCGATREEIICVPAFGGPDRWLVKECRCPVPCCPFCITPLDTHGRCANLGCFLVGHIAPIPEDA